MVDQRGRPVRVRELNSAVDAGMVASMSKQVQAVPGQKTWKDLGLDDLRKVSDALRTSSPPVYEQAGSEGQALSMVRSALGMGNGGGTIHVKTPIETVVVTDENLFHLIEKRINARERYAEYILPTLKNPYGIWGTAYDDGGTRNRYIGLFTGKTDIAIMVKIEKDGGIVWNMMNADRARINKFREGKLLWSK